MKTMMKLFFTAFALLQLHISGALADIGSSFEYDWTGGQPGFSGKIFVDAPSSTLALHGGTDADVLPGSYLTTPLGTFSVLNMGLDAAFGAPASSTTWDPTHIIYMNLFFDSTSPINNPAYNQPAIGAAVASPFSFPNSALEVGSIVGGFGTAFFEDDFTGHWLAAPVPEPSILPMLFLGCVAACGRRHFSRTFSRRRLLVTCDHLPAHR